MSDAHDRPDTERQASEAFARADQAWIFGPSFFLTQLRRFVRDHCPPTAEQLPQVQMRLSDGHTLDVCHVIGVSPRWVLLAVQTPGHHSTEMAVEFVPFASIQAVRMSARRAESGSVGFAQHATPTLMPAETLLSAAVSDPAPSDGGA